MVPVIDTAIEWPIEIIDRIEDPILKGDILDARHNFTIDWENFQDVVKAYPNALEK